MIQWRGVVERTNSWLGGLRRFRIRYDRHQTIIDAWNHLALADLCHAVLIRQAAEHTNETEVFCQPLKDVDAAKVVLDRGGNAGKVRKVLADKLKAKTAEVIANLAAQWDETAEAAMKIINQAKKKGDEYKE